MNVIPITRKQEQEAANHIASALETLGINLLDENFIDTPSRFVRYLMEYLQPFDPHKVMKVDFSQSHSDQGYKGMVVQSNIPFRTICPHHLLPVIGHAHLGYIPGGKVVGISKLTRIVDAVGHEMPRMQETCTDIIADILYGKELGAKGVIVSIVADHGCMFGRGVRVHDTPTSTSTVRGLFMNVSAAREEFFALTQIARNR